MAGQTRRLGADNWKDEVESSTLPYLVDFWAAWCGPCRQIAPSIEELATRFEGRANVGKVDVDAEPELAARFRVASIPTLLVFRDGQVVDQRIGAAGLAELERFLEAHTSEAAGVR
jgi:thioredoxin 1